MDGYTITDISTTLGVSERTVQRWINSLVFIDKNKTIIPQDVYQLLLSRHKPDTSTTIDDIVVEEFTKSEYAEFHKRLSEYPFLKEQITIILNELDYHKKSAESHNRQMEIILNSMQQRNFIEAKEKKLDK